MVPLTSLTNIYATFMLHFTNPSSRIPVRSTRLDSRCRATAHQRRNAHEFSASEPGSEAIQPSAFLFGIQTMEPFPVMGGKKGGWWHW